MRIKAFTILEALISLILISIIIGLVFTLINFMNKQFMIIAKENSQELEYYLFNTSFNRDTNNANDFELSQNVIILKNYNKPNITYTFTKDNVYRDNGITKGRFNLKITHYLLNENNLELLHKKKIELDIILLNDVIKAKYFLKRDCAKIINKTFYNED